MKNCTFLHLAHHASYCIHKVSKPSLILSSFLPQKRKSGQRIQYKPTRVHNTRAYIKKRMATTEQDNIELREEVSNLKEGLEKLTATMAT